VSTHLPPFLCLPLPIRHQIYIDAGVLRRYNNILYFNIDSCDHNSTRLDAFRVSHSLLLTCHTIYTEISDIIYSRNKFSIRYKDAHSLKALRDLAPHSITRLTQLTVHLNVTSCLSGGACWKLDTGLKDDKSLESSLETILSEWQITALYIAAHIRPARLSLYFVCDVNDLETATRALEPLSSFPTLADCSIRLARQPDHILRDMAQQAAMRVMGYQDRSNQTFPFLSLPCELRQQILQYTDLVTPLREIEWNPESKFHLYYSTAQCGGPLHGEYPLQCPLNIHRACRFRNCWENSPQGVGCFCHEYHAAFSSKCKCWSPPTSLFLVCKQLREDAQVIFFSKNRFIIRPPGTFICPVESTPTRLEISIFLTDIVPSHMLQFLRFLEIVFPPFHDDYLRPHEPAYQDWLKAVDYASELLNLPMLTLDVYFFDYLYHCEPTPDFRNNMTKEQGLKIVRTYARTLRPLSKLRANGLSRFSALASYP
jgi:hypothetical protein